MTKCEELQNKIDSYITRAINADDVDVKAFFYKAAKHIEYTRDNMLVEELSKVVE